MKIIGVIPAHNEESTLEETLDSLRSQVMGFDRILVVADNCSDSTVSIAENHGVEVFCTQNNKDKKSGALNQAIESIDSSLADDDLILVMDADTELSPEYVKEAVRRLSGNPYIGAVGGSFSARNEDNLIQIVQANEYHRYVREICRRKQARANVLTGAGSIFRVSVLREVRAARESGILPGTGFYKQDALTEDNELSLAIKTLGYMIVSPRKCMIYTDAPSTWKELFDQRLRWRRGALEDLLCYGLSKVTLPYVGKMLWSVFVTVISALYMYLIVASLIGRTNPFTFSPFWTGVFVLYMADRWWTVRDRSIKAQAVALVIPIEIFYDMFQQVVLVRAVADFALRAEQRWVHTTIRLGEV